MRNSLSTCFLALGLVVGFATREVYVAGFSLAQLSVPKNSLGRSCFEKRCNPLCGILDEYEGELASSAKDGTASSSGSSSEKQVSAEVPEATSVASYQRLFDALIFGNNVKALITDKLEESTDAGFQQFLKESQANAEDPEEAQAYQDLIVLINNVQEELHTKQLVAQAALQERLKEIEEEAAVAAAATNRNRSTNADVMKQVAAVDQAIITASAEATEDEKPDNFMRDAKAVRGLSGFNNKGNMRVGGG